MIYVIKNYEGYFKIGRTKNFKSRYVQHNTANSTDLEIISEIKTSYLNDSKIESYLHRYFKHRHIRREWFDLSKEDIKQIEFITKQQDKIFKNIFSPNNFLMSS